MTAETLIRREARAYGRAARRWLLRVLCAAFDLVAAGAAVGDAEVSKP